MEYQSRRLIRGSRKGELLGRPQVLCDGKVPAKLKGRVYKIMVRLAKLYGMEPVAVTMGQEIKIDAAEMRMLRFALGKTRMDNMQNETIRETIGVTKIAKVSESAG